MDSNIPAVHCDYTEAMRVFQVSEVGTCENMYTIRYMIEIPRVLYLPPEHSPPDDSSPLVRRAYEIAAMAHDGDFRKINMEPFITHPLDVADLAAVYSEPEDVGFVRVVSVLHDVVDMRRARERFPLAVIAAELARYDRAKEDYAGAISSLSKIIDTDMSWREKCELYLPKAATTTDARIQTVRASDKIDNVRKATSEIELIGDDFWRYFKGDKKGYIWWPHAVYHAIEQSRVLSGAPILQLYEDALSDFNHTLDRLEQGKINPRNSA